MQNKKELQEENAALIKKNEGYVRDIFILEKEKLRLMDKWDKLSHELDNEKARYIGLEELKKDAEAEVRQLKKELSHLTDVRNVLSELKKSIGTSNLILEDRNNQLLGEIEKLESENQYLKSDIDMLKSELDKTEYLKGKVDAYEMMPIFNNSLQGKDTGVESYNEMGECYK